MCGLVRMAQKRCSQQYSDRLGMSQMWVRLDLQHFEVGVRYRTRHILVPMIRRCIQPLKYRQRLENYNSLEQDPGYIQDWVNYVINLPYRKFAVSEIVCTLVSVLKT